MENQAAAEDDQTRSVCINYRKSLADDARYGQLRQRLRDLDSRRQQRQRRLDQLQHLQKLLGPFREPQKTVQPNLVTRDGELVQELEKLRILAARVGGRIRQSKRKRDVFENDDTPYSFGSERKMDALLELT